MAEVNKDEGSHIHPEAFDETMPFLAMFAERGYQWTLAGGYNESLGVWVVGDQPLVTSSDLALETTTFTRTGGEGQDRD